MARGLNGQTLARIRKAIKEIVEADEEIGAHHWSYIRTQTGRHTLTEAEKTFAINQWDEAQRKLS